MATEPKWKSDELWPNVFRFEPPPKQHGFDAHITEKKQDRERALSIRVSRAVFVLFLSIGFSAGVCLVAKNALEPLIKAVGQAASQYADENRKTQRQAAEQARKKAHQAAEDARKRAHQDAVDKIAITQANTKQQVALMEAQARISREAAEEAAKLKAQADLTPDAAPSDTSTNANNAGPEPIVYGFGGKIIPKDARELYAGK